MPASPQQIFDRMVNETRAKIEAEEASRQTPAIPDALTRTITQVSEALPKLVEQNQALTARLEQIEKRNQPSPQSGDDPYAKFGEYGISREHFAPVLEREVAPMIERTVQNVFEKQFGGAVRESEAIQAYQKDHRDFDVQKLNSYISGTPEVAQIVAAAKEKGAYGLAIEYAETRRVMDEKISQEARATGRARKRNEMIADTRPDAQIVGGTGANGGTARNDNVKRQPTMEEMATAFNHADSGDWTHFEKLFVNPRLPSEEYFQQLAQS
jgi:hypothetical protein